MFPETKYRIQVSVVTKANWFVGGLVRTVYPLSFILIIIIVLILRKLDDCHVPKRGQKIIKR